MATLFQFPFRTYAEISLPAIVKNLVTLRALSQREVIPVIKADAYGHGMIPVARVLINRGGCRMLAVATLEEALELRKNFSSVSILVLSGFYSHQIEAYIRNEITPQIYSLSQLKQLQGRKELPPIHVKLDSGMNRLGIPENEMEPLLRLLEKMKLKLSGVSSHFAESESIRSTFTDAQIKKFEGMLQALRSRRFLNTDARVHVSNTAAILRHKLGSSISVRPGLGLFGVTPNDRIGNSRVLTPVMQWKARLITIKSIQKGETVGYGRTYQTKRKELLGVLGIGYADGYPRALSNKGEVLMGGKRVRVRGIVSMDLTSIDLSEVSQPKEGMLATLLGTDGKNSVTAWDLAHWADTIPYEIFCQISTRVPRIYLE